MLRHRRRVRVRMEPVSVGGVTGLAAGLVVLGPALAPGFLLVYDMVFVPEPNFGTRALGLDGSVPRAVPNDLMVSVLSLLLPGWVVQKVLLIAVFVLVGAGMGALVRTRPGAAVAAVAACWNPYVAERLALGHWAFLLGYALIPWVARSAAGVVGGEPAAYRRLAFWVLLASLCGSTAALMATLTAFLVLALPSSGRVRPQPGARLRGMAVLGLMTVLANAAWWVPAVLIPGRLPADPQGVAAFAARADSPLGLVASLITGGGVWHERLWPSERGSMVFALVMLLVAVASVVWLVWRWHSAHPAASGILTAGIVGIVLAAAGSTALVEGATAVVTRIPGGGLIRDGHKFVAPWMILVACAVGNVGDDLWAGWRRQGVSTLLSPFTRSTLILGLALLPVVTMPSLAFGAFRGWGAADYPDSYLAAASHVDSHDDASVASFPWTLYRRYAWNRGDVVLDPWPRLVESRVLVNDDLPLSTVTVAGEDKAADRVGEAVASGDPAEVRRALHDVGARFVLFHRDQPTSASEGAFFEGVAVVMEDRWIRLYDLGEAASVPKVLPRWAWIGLAGTGSAVILVLGAHAAAARNRGVFLARRRVSGYDDGEGKDSM